MVVLLVAGTFAGCAGADRTSDEESERRVVGEPPSESDDPFEVMKTPEEERRAERSGYIGERGEETESKESASEAADSPDRADSPSESAESPSKSSESSGESERTTAEVSEAEPTAEQTPDEPPAPSEHRCFSCVRICPVDADDGDTKTACGDRQRDVVCGWGVHEERSRAKKLARAECDGAVDLAGQMDQWSEIKGGCPPASCRSPD